MSASSQVLLYNGPGADPFCFQAFRNQLYQALDYNFHTVKEISDFSQNFCDPNSISAVCVPGGNAATMFVTIRDTKNAQESLKELFEKYHVSFYGAGAGGILVSSESFDTYTLPNGAGIQCYDKSSSYLGIFPGKTIAPLFVKPQEKLSIADFHLLNIRLNNLTKSTFPSVQVLSPGYLNVDQIKGAEILSSYDTAFTTIRSAMEGAIIDQKTLSESLFYESNGTKIILTGSFHEMDSIAAASESFKKAFNMKSQQQKNIVEQMKPDDAARHSCFKNNLERLGLHCIPDNFRVKLDYENKYFWRQNQLPIFDANAPAFRRNSEDLSLQGLTMGFRLDF